MNEINDLQARNMTSRRGKKKEKKIVRFDEGDFFPLHFLDTATVSQSEYYLTMKWGF